MDARLWHIDHALSVLSPYGTSWVEKLQNDCAWAIDLIKQKKFPDPTQFNPLLKIFPAALDAAYSMLTAAEAIPRYPCGRGRRAMGRLHGSRGTASS